MTVNKLIRDAVLPIVPVCEPNEYDGEAEEYCVFTVDDYPDVYAEGRAHETVHHVILDWYLPKTTDPIARKCEICNALITAGCTSPFVQTASDEIGQHFTLEFEVSGGDLYGKP